LGTRVCTGGRGASGDGVEKVDVCVDETTDVWISDDIGQTGDDTCLELVDAVVVCTMVIVAAIGDGDEVVARGHGAGRECSSGGGGSGGGGSGKRDIECLDDQLI
jgi:hypothetical protein